MVLARKRYCLKSPVEVLISCVSGTEAEGDKTLDRYIVDYLLRTGRLGSAKALAEKKNIEVGKVWLVLHVGSWEQRADVGVV